MANEDPPIGGTPRPLDDATASALLEASEPFGLPPEAPEATIASLLALIASFNQRINELGGTPISNIPGTSSPVPDAPISSGTPPIIPDPTLSTTSSMFPVATPTFGSLLGDFLAESRSELELEHASMQVISKDDRTRLSASDKGKVYAAFVKGVTNKFKASNTIVGLDEISTIENIMSFGQQRSELQKHITSISAHSVFLILKFDSAHQLIDPDSAAGRPVNLLSVSTLPDTKEIEDSVSFYYRRGSTFHQENLSWTYDAIRNSCDKDLQGILDARMLKYKVSERFGPLYYFELVQHMTNVDSKAVRAITQELTSLKVPDQEGQSIAKIAKLIRSTVIWLDMVRMLPPDIDAVVLDILETCTVADFQLYIKTLTANASLNGLKLSYDDLLVKAEEQYRILVLSKRWDAIDHQGASFQAQRNNTTTSNSRGGPRTRTPVPMPSWHRTPPGAGEPHERSEEGKDYKYCATCKRWFFGYRAHLTSEHTAGFRRQPSSQLPNDSSSSSNNVTGDNNTPPETEASPEPAPLARTYFNAGL